MARARLQMKRQRTEEADADLKAALALTEQANPNQAQTFFAGMSVVFPDQKERLTALTRLKPKEGYKAWVAFLYSNLKASFPESQAEGMSELRELAENGTVDLKLRKQAYAVIGSRHRMEKNYDEAIRWWKVGLELDAADPELNNNVAYCTCEDLKKPAEALPYAERAAKALGNNPSILDTLGTVYMRMNTLDKGEETFGRGLSVAGSADEAVPLLLHLAELRLLQGKKGDAEALIRRGEELMNTDPELKKAFEGLLKELKGKLQSN
jgi:tetratricopeptide (TPR) repeat protein